MNNRARAVLGAFVAAVFLVAACGPTDGPDERAEDGASASPENDMPAPAPGDVIPPGESVSASESGVCAGVVVFQGVTYASPTKDREDEVPANPREGALIGTGERPPCSDDGQATPRSSIGSPVQVRALDGVDPATAIWIDQFGVLLAPAD